MTAWDQRVRYTDEDKAKLKLLWQRRDLSHEQIAKEMGRSVPSVKVKAVALNLGRRPKEWSFGSARLRKQQQEAQG